MISELKPSFLFFLLLSSLVFSYYSDPPHQDVENTNKAISSTIQNTYVSKGPAKSPSIDDPVKFADARILTVLPSIDNRISDKVNSTVFWVYGIDYENTLAGPNSLSDDRCLGGQSTVTFVSSAVNPKMMFLYQNNSKEITLIQSDFFQTLPFNRDELLSEKQERLNITLHGNISLKYSRTDTYQRYTCLAYSDGVCTSQGCFPFTEEREVEIIKPFSHSVSYEVENGPITNFLSSPVLSEQWYKNNVFNNVVLSKRKFSKGIFRLNDAPISNISLYVFDIIADDYGVKSIKSLESYNASKAEAAFYFANNITIPAIQNSTGFFPYVYQFNTTYEAVGRNNLSLELQDHFSNSFFIEESIMSRRISFNQVVDDGASPSGNVKNEIIRPGATVKEEILYRNIINLGALVLLLLVVFFRR